jgi:hypothetical protein
MMLVQSFVLTFLMLVATIACTPQPKGDETAEIIKKTITAAGCSNFEGTNIQFDFRGMRYRSYRINGIFELQRIQFDSVGNEIKDVLTNDGLKRYFNDTLVAIEDSMAAKYAASVNSVHYFANLPLGLSDPAVRAENLGTTEIKGKGYHKLKITFSEEGGGDDHQDIFLYWIDPINYTIDYLAYQYFTEGGGIRFREAYNIRTIGGIRFADYHNYKAETTANFLLVDSLFNSGKLELLSEINLENIEVIKP